ncbi:ABC1 kinase family protein [Desulfothermus sp.]
MPPIFDTVDILYLSKINRYKKIALTLAKYGFEDIVARLQSVYPFKISPKKATNIPKDTYKRIRLVLEELGPTFVKFGQMLSLRTDLIPVQLTQELSQLQDMVEGEEYEVIVKQLEKSLQKKVDEVFSYVNPTPLAAGSIAQVHEAVLKKENIKVAIKIQRPNIEHIIKTDLKILEDIANVIHGKIEFLKVYSLPEIVQEIKKMILNELDFKREVRNIKIATYNFKDDKRFYLPKVFDEYSTKDIIVMEKLEGLSLKNSIPKMDYDTRKKIAHHLLDIFIKQIFEHGFFHADPHPGNIFILQDNRISLLDWGMTGRISNLIKFKLIDLVEGVVKKDIDQVMDVILFLTYQPPSYDLISLSLEVHDIIDEYYSVPLKDIDMGKMLLEVTNILHKYKMRIRPEIAVLDRAFITSEGSGRLLYPEVDVISELKPYVKKLVLTKMAPSNVYSEFRKGLSSLSLLKNYPKKIDRLLDKLDQNKLSIGFEHKKLDNLIKTMDRITNRLTLGLITASMIIGSSMIITTKIPPLIFGYPALGLIGYVFSALLGGGIILDILKKKKF